MNTYAPLDSGILLSSVWSESPEIRCVWITMLAMKDKDGIVHASIPGLAHMARVSLEVTEQAVAKFLNADPYSRTKEHDGRRIEPVDGGWLVLNHTKYRNKYSNSPGAIRARKYRENHKDKSVTKRYESVTRNVTDVTPVSVSGSGSILNLQEGESEGKPAEKPKRQPKPKPDTLSFGEGGHVQLTQEEYDKLVTREGQERTEAAIGVLDGYIGSSGKRYKSHYSTMHTGSWVWDRVEDVMRKANLRRAAEEAKRRAESYDPLAPI